jgi:hypothetical protein
MRGALGRTIVRVVLGGALALAIGRWLGRLAAG